MRLLSILIIAMGSACGSTQHATSDVKSMNQEPQKGKKPVVEMGYSSDTDPYSITEAHVEGTNLHIKTQYAGGCENHTFELFTNGMIMKSLPPKQSFFLRHYAHDDSCEQSVEEELVFDLSGTTVTGNTLILLLQNFDGDLKMEF